MKTLLLSPLLAALLGGSPALAQEDLLGSGAPELSFNDESSDDASDKITFNGAEHPKYVDADFRGPLLPGQQVRPGPNPSAAAAAFNAHASMPPMETITVTGADGKTYNHQAWFTRDEKGLITGGQISFDTGGGCGVPVDIGSLANKKNLLPEERAYLADVAKNKERYAMPSLLAAAGVDQSKQQAENKGFDPTGGFKGAQANPRPASTEEPGPKDVGTVMGQEIALALSGDGSGLFASSNEGGQDGGKDGASSARQPVVYKGEVTAFSAGGPQGGITQLWNDTDRALSNFDRAAKSFAPTPAGGENVTPAPCATGDLTRGACVRPQ